MTNLIALKDWFECLDEKSLSEIGHYYEEEAYFKDPFNEIKGLEKIEKIFKHMFKTTVNPRFKIIDFFSEGENAFFSWVFIFGLYGKEYKINGSSHLKLSPNGKINYHRDYWDVGEELLLKIPLVSVFYKILQKQLATK